MQWVATTAMAAWVVCAVSTPAFGQSTPAQLVLRTAAQPAGGASGAGERARQALSSGRLDEAERLATEGGNDPVASLVRAQVAEVRGQLDRADAAYREAITRPSNGDATLNYGLFLIRRGRIEEGRKILQPLMSRATGATTAGDMARAARAARAVGEFRLANGLYREAAGAAPDSAAINTAWGDLLLEKHNLQEAARSYQIALKSDPDYAPAHLGLGRALADDNPPAARASAARALKLNPTLWDAALLDASLVFDRGDRAEARQLAEKILEQNPAYLEAHALLAGIAWVEDRKADYEAAVAKALAVNPKWGEVYRVVAEHAAGRYRFDDAASMARRATALDPSNARAWADLGKHLLRTGDEAEARVALDRAWEDDPFDQITFNLLSLMDTLKDFRSIESGSLVVKLDPEEAAMMREPVMSLAKTALSTLSQRYGFTPKGPILIEMFPKHDDFAVRNVGLPGMIGALGACFGRVVTLDSPKARPPGSFNWEATLWHELAHVVTLQMSGQRVPRWLTEGISVYEERRARPYWGRESEFQFVDALSQNETFTIANLNSGFSDPRRITLAYQQASIVVEHLVDRFGDQVLPRLMRAYGEGLSDDAAVQKVTGVGIPELQKSFDAFVDAKFGASRRALARVEGLEQALSDVKALETLAASHADNFNVQMALGQARLEAKDLKGSRDAFERAAKLMPSATGTGGPRAMVAQVAELAGDAAGQRAALADAINEHYTALDLSRKLLEVSLTAGDRDRQRVAANRIVEIDPFDARAYAVIGRLAFANGDHPAAVTAFRQALQAGPADPVAAHTDLAEVLLASGARAEAKAQAIVALELAPRFERAQDILLAVVDNQAPPRPKQ
jgi:tetratricopeptide (TPR) repeat protein